MTSLLARWLRLFSLALAGWFFAAPAWADALDEFIGYYQQVESQAPAGAMPINSSYLVDSKTYIQCIAGGEDVLICTDTYSDTPAGKDATSAAGVPTGFRMALDAYVAYAQGDYWSAAWSLGQAAACVFLNIVTGTDLCGLIQVLYDTAKAIYEGFEAVLGFLSDVLGAGWEVMGNLAKGFCQGINLCDEDDGPPLHVTLLKTIYAPYVVEGVNKRENSVEGDYEALLAALKAQATVWAKQLYAGILASVPSVEGQIDAHIKSSIAQAETAFTAAVDQAWTGDILGRVVKDQQMPKRAEYIAHGIDGLASEVAKKFLQGNNDPSWLVSSLCQDTFSNSYGFALVDRWIAHFPAQAAEFKIKTNLAWCQDTVWGTYRNKFVPGFVSYLQSHLCSAGSGQRVVCDSLEAYQRCTRLLGSVEKSDLCQVNTLKLGQEAAAKIQADFISRGSKIPCAVITPKFLVGLSVQAQHVKLQCPRPTQRAACEDTYQRLFGALPTRVLDCTLLETLEYQALKEKTASAVASLNSDLQSQYGIPVLAINASGDPLVVLAAGKEVVTDVQNHANQNWGFPPPCKPGFDYLFFVPKIIDGLNCPALWHEVDLPHATRPGLSKVGALKEAIDPAGPISDARNPLVNPFDELRARAPAAQVGLAVAPARMAPGGLPALPAAPGALHAGPSTVRSGTTNTMGGLPALAPITPLGTRPTATVTTRVTPQATPQVSGATPMREQRTVANLARSSEVAAPPAMLAGTGEALSVRSAPAPQQPPVSPESVTPMMGSAPTTVRGPAPAIMPVPALAGPGRLPDLVFAGMPRIGGQATAWGGMVSLNASAATRAGGVCHFPLDFQIGNHGSQSAEPFRVAVRNAAVPGSGWVHGMSAQNAGAVQVDSGSIGLLPGRNSLQFVLDDSGQVAESNEANNTATLAVNVSGDCQSFSPATPVPSQAPARVPRGSGPDLLRR